MLCQHVCNTHTSAEGTIREDMCTGPDETKSGWGLLEGGLGSGVRSGLRKGCCSGFFLSLRFASVDFLFFLLRIGVG